MSATTDTVLYFEELGGPEKLRIGPWPRRPLRPGEVRLRVQAFALNRADLMYLNGEHYTIPDLPTRIGSEAVGTVIEVAPGVTGVALGDRVSTMPFFTPDGVQGDVAVVPADYLAPADDRLGDAQACSVWMQYLTPYLAFVEVCRLRPGDAVLVTAATSTAGLGAVEIARSLGLSTIATTRSPGKADLLREAGATAVAVAGTDDLGRVIAEATGGRGVDAAFDPIGGRSLADYVDHLAQGAVVLGYGTLSDEQPEIPVAAMCRARAVFHPYSMFNHIDDPRQRRGAVRFISDRITTGELTPRVDRVFPFEEAVEAYRYMQSNQQAGKIVVTVP